MAEKRKNKWIVLLLSTIASLALLGYYIFNPGKALSFVFPDIDSIRYVNAIIRHDSAHTRINLVLKNTNPYKLSIDSLRFEVKLNDTSIAKQCVVMNTKQAGFSKDIASLPLDLKIKKIRSVIAHLQGQDSTDFEMTGSIGYETLFGRTTLHFSRKKRIEVPVPPEIKILKVERKHFDRAAKVLYANIYIQIANKGKNLDLILSDLSYEFSVRDHLHSEGLIPSIVPVKPRSSITVTVPLRIEVFHPLKTAWLIGTDKDRLPYELTLKGKVKENISEKSLSSPAEISASGFLELVK